MSIGRLPAAAFWPVLCSILTEAGGAENECISTVS